jgi:hypothetical protein
MGVWEYGSMGENLLKIKDSPFPAVKLLALN